MPSECPRCEVLLPDAVNLETSGAGPKSVIQVDYCPGCGEEPETAADLDGGRTHAGP